MGIIIPVFVQEYICVCVFVCVCLCSSVHVHVPLSVSVLVHVFACVCVCVLDCARVSMCICVCVYVRPLCCFLHHDEWLPVKALVARERLGRGLRQPNQQRLCQGGVAGEGLLPGGVVGLGHGRDVELLHRDVPQGTAVPCSADRGDTGSRGGVGQGCV